MTKATPTIKASAQISDWKNALDAILGRLEDAEMGLSSQGPGRRDSGSYYTPADVTAHFWNLFWRHHGVESRLNRKAFIDHGHFVEPSIGSGMFLFGMLRSLAEIGLGPQDVSAIAFSGVDINQSALDFVRSELSVLEEEFSMHFSGVTLERSDFLEWIANRDTRGMVFVGNPPFVSNAKGAVWKNLYADFVEAMLKSGRSSIISLILPVSVCFSRDYVLLRRLMKNAEVPISASSYDNIPDCLFKSGKPESGNTNKANSQRCTILNLGGERTGLIESSALLRWATGGRREFLEAIPQFHDCSHYDIERQIPRPTDAHLAGYLREAENGRSVRELVSRIGRGAFAVGGVARNFIGIRDYEGRQPGIIPVRTNEADTSLVLLQILASDIFYKYWRSFGDGFHVTNDLVDRFPISKRLLSACEENLTEAKSVWTRRESFAKIKLNAGKIVKSYDFTPVFSTIM